MNGRSVAASVSRAWGKASLHRRGRNLQAALPLCGRRACLYTGAGRLIRLRRNVHDTLQPPESAKPCGAAVFGPKIDLNLPPPSKEFMLMSPHCNV